MATKTTGDLELWKPELTDPVTQTIGTHLPQNFDKIDEAITELNEEIENLGSDKVDQADIVDNLTEGGTDKVLSAEQGKVLSTQISQLATQANMSLTNELINSSFEDDLNAWPPRAGTTYATIDTEVKLLGGKSLRLTAPDVSVARAQDINGSIGDKFYVTAHVYKRSGTDAMVYVLAKDSPAGAIGYVMHLEAYNSMAVEVWTRYSSVITATNDGIRVQIGRTNARTFDFNVDGVCAINLTAAFGAGNEPTVAEMDALFAILPDGWFEGTLTLTQKQITTWLLNLIRANTAAIVAL